MKKPTKVVKPEPTSPVMQDVIKMKVLRQAANPQWVYCQAVERDLGKVPVVIPRRMTDKLVGKIIDVEVIADNVGTSYRYVQDRSY